ncbi:DUF3644 domain-containing protein [Corynebacterium sp. p3-SID1056]|uniref:DUF3644 domain-containing protein n=1 Tax=Corynebacterium sp. p3-SID1056 TaxID=2916092 RepID=UPI0021A455B3|nr:DUF3644 domain-containing protein [Corynebacterium sp. p3-SID1056]MCT2339133.1 DUF3644 domain-containing protein [Corynebacterium sp. p3-SID1056]
MSDEKVHQASGDHVAKRLLDKSKEAFALAVELYNRPTLRYHAEACSIFLCNAWELMLKAHLIEEEGLEAIYYPDNPDRTISLEDCLKRIFSNDKSPLRVNMRELIRFRNTNTHFITDEYELFYGPFLQAAVTNYAEQLENLHGDSVSDIMPENHLTLAVRRGSIEPEVIRAKYDPAVAKKLLENQRDLASVVGDEGNSSVAAVYETSLRLVKRQQDADLNVFVTKDASEGVSIVKDIRDASSYYPFRTSACIEKVNARLKGRGVKIFFGGEEIPRFNKFHFNLFVKGHNFKGDSRFSYNRNSADENPYYVYSQRAIEFIVERLSKEPDTYLDKLKHHSTSAK